MDNNQPPHQLIQTQHVQHLVHGDNAAGRFNARLAVWITRAVGTMYCAYFFALIAFTGFPQAISHALGGDPGALVLWFSSEFAQLVLLPVIIVGQNVISTAQDARAETDHQMLMTLHEINTTQLAILQSLRDHGIKVNNEEVA
jgi:hypothetical protein